MTQPRGRVGALHRAKLRKWSDKVAREHAARDAARRRPLDAARKTLRRLFR